MVTDTKLESPGRPHSEKSVDDEPIKTTLVNDGVPADADLAIVTPTEERFSEGPVVTVECFQQIPCNPCVKACKQSAITMPHDINDLPKVDTGKCNGCSLCISKCPGLAIFVVDKTYSETHALVKLPYEYVPVPQAGQSITGLNRAGDKLGNFEVVRVTSGGKKNMTYTISLAIPHELAMEVRGVRV